MVLIKTLVLKNFRNHTDLTLRFGDGINLIVGENALGKTNILESIYLIGRGRPFRSTDYRDMIMWGENGSFVDAVIENGKGMTRAQARLDERKKTFCADGKGKRSIEGAHVVLFSPQDISIFKKEPSERRAAIDDIISAVELFHASVSKEYAKVVAQKNRVLKDCMEKGWSSLKDQISIWTERQIYLGIKVMMKRDNFIKKINRLLPEIFSFMGGVGSGAKIEYMPNVTTGTFDEISIEKVFRAKLAEKAELERIRGMTLVGPHRDDWATFVDGKNISVFGSQSQMRMMALSLKVAELAMFRESFGETPVLLLDDVMSELDDVSADRLLKYVDDIDGQVFITAASEDRFIRKHGINVIRVQKNGRDKSLENS